MTPASPPPFPSCYTHPIPQGRPDVTQPENRKDSIWSLVAGARHWYFGIFLLLFIIGAAFLIAGEIRAEQDIIDTVTGVFLGLGAIGAAAAITSFALTETGRIAMVLAHDLKIWLENRRKKRLAEAIAKATEEAISEGRAEANKAWTAWNTRREEAEARGQPFTEPPPVP